jgi:hypothetical protein
MVTVVVLVAELIGVWRGDSVCTQKPSPCNDEHVVYHVAKGEGDDGVSIQANKIVDGKELEMGTLACTLDPQKADLRCPIAKGVFELHVSGDEMTGTLRLTDGTIYRRIAVKHERKRAP